MRGMVATDDSSTPSATAAAMGPIESMPTACTWPTRPAALIASEMPMGPEASHAK